MTGGTENGTVNFEPCGSRLLQRTQTASSIESRLDSIKCQSRNELKQKASSAPPSNFICGERMNDSRVRTLSALYRPTFEKLPTFPSIYQTKYQRDFKYIPFPISSNFKPTPVRNNYDDFKFGTTSYNHHYHFNQEEINIKQCKRQPIPCSRNRHNNPQPSIKLVQNHPDNMRWSWSKLESIKTPAGNKGPKLQFHRWNSR